MRIAEAERRERRRSARRWECTSAGSVAPVGRGAGGVVGSRGGFGGRLKETRGRDPLQSLRPSPLHAQDAAGRALPRAAGPGRRRRQDGERGRQLPGLGEGWGRRARREGGARRLRGRAGAAVSNAAVGRRGSVAEPLGRAGFREACAVLRCFGCSPGVRVNGFVSTSRSRKVGGTRGGHPARARAGGELSCLFPAAGGSMLRGCHPHSRERHVVPVAKIILKELSLFVFLVLF